MQSVEHDGGGECRIISCHRESSCCPLQQVQLTSGLAEIRLESANGRLGSAASRHRTGRYRRRPAPQTSTSSAGTMRRTLHFERPLPGVGISAAAFRQRIPREDGLCPTQNRPSSRSDAAIGSSAAFAGFASRKMTFAEPIQFQVENAFRAT